MRTTRHRGFNLLEVLFAITLFGGIVIALLNVWITYAKTVERSANLLAASSLAQAVMEDQMALGFRAATEDPTPVTMERTVNGTTVAVDFIKSVYVQDRSTDFGPDIKWVKVTITWHEAQGDQKIMLESYVGWTG